MSLFVKNYFIKYVPPCKGYGFCFSVTFHNNYYLLTIWSFYRSDFEFKCENRSGVILYSPIVCRDRTWYCNVWDFARDHSYWPAEFDKLCQDDVLLMPLSPSCTPDLFVRADFCFCVAVAMKLTLTVIETNNGTLHELCVKSAHFSPEYQYRNY